MGVRADRRHRASRGHRRVHALRGRQQVPDQRLRAPPRRPARDRLRQPHDEARGSLRGRRPLHPRVRHGGQARHGHDPVAGRRGAGQRRLPLFAGRRDALLLHERHHRRRRGDVRGGRPVGDLPAARARPRTPELQPGVADVRRGGRGDEPLQGARPGAQPDAPRHREGPPLGAGSGLLHRRAVRADPRIRARTRPPQGVRPLPDDRRVRVLGVRPRGGDALPTRSLRGPPADGARRERRRHQAVRPRGRQHDRRLRRRYVQPSSHRRVLRGHYARQLRDHPRERVSSATSCFGRGRRSSGRHPGYPDA